ncbi:MAG: hypothetical protein IJA66_00040 [Alistipes sp.]|nr:hypothetical protein [Alistipes sp.]
MKIEQKLTQTRGIYAAPKAEYVEIPVEMGFAVSGELEEVGKDDEVDF